MKKTILLTAALALTLGACGGEKTKTAEVNDPQPQMQSLADANLTAALDAQPAEVKARYQYRHPKETLEFFEVMPGQTVAEALPGGGWYSKILLPYLGEDGKLIGIDYSLDMWPHFGGFATPEFIEGKKTWPETWTADARTWAPGTADIGAYTFATIPADVHGTVDRVLFIRALHNMARFEDKGPYLAQAAEQSYLMLKPGGIVGVVQHRAPEGASDEWAKGQNGYIKESRVIAAFKSAGFELVESSEINANTADKPTEEDMVWRLPPTLGTSRARDGDDAETLANKEGLRAGYEAIGESDRMTLKFRKPE